MSRKRQPWLWGWAVFGLLLATAAGAAEPEKSGHADADAPQLLEAMVVSGIQPGPGLWKVSNADGHVLWILGTLSPLPRRMQWESAQVRQVIGESQQVLLPPSGRVKADVGFFGGMALLPAALSARKNPDKQTLAEVLPAPLYARWTPLRQRYLGRGKGIEKRRPLLAANKLFEAAIGRHGLSQKDVVVGTVKKLAKRAKVPVDQPLIEVVIDEPKQALKDFAKSDLDDRACFEQTLSRVENDLPLMRDRANAWATGDIEALQDLPDVDHLRTCSDAFLNASAIQQRGLGDLRDRLQARWLEAAEQSLVAHPSTLAILPLNLILREDGYLALLAERGYQIQAPETH
ncbi:MAG: TraB/GumN family protein [Xanthomonadales bacterium]|nr:TraB/GumN family protein [Xanthomonadales bacterium]